MRQADKKYFGDVQQGRLNSDDSPFVVGTNEWVNAENIRTGSTDKGFTGVVESVGGNAELPSAKISSTFYLNLDFSIPVPGTHELSQIPSTLNTSAIAVLNIDYPLLVGTYINGYLTDPIYGLIYISNYTTTANDTSKSILARNLSNNINLNSYGYTSYVDSNDLINIVARPGAGSSINGTIIYGMPGVPTNPAFAPTVNGGQYGTNDYVSWAGTGNFITWFTNTNSIGSGIINSGFFNIKCAFSHNSTITPIVSFKLYGVQGSSVYVLLGSGNASLNIQNIKVYDFNIDVQASAIQFDYLMLESEIIVSNGVIKVYPQSANSLVGVPYYSYANTNILDIQNSGYDYITIGSVEDIENKRIIYFNYDQSSYRQDAIFCYYTELNKQYLVLQSNQVIGGLNFDKNYLIHSAKISNGNTLSWTEGLNNEPRKINIESGIIANDSTFQTSEISYNFPLNFSEITLIKRPPIYTPNIQKLYDSLYLNNFISKNSFEFAFQYEYYDSEISVIGSYSQASRLNYDYQNFNYISVSMDSNEFIPSTVKTVNLIARIGDGVTTGSQTAVIVKTWNKENPLELSEIDNHNSNSGNTLSFNFYNDISGQFIASDDVLRPFDNVPIFSQTHEVSKSRYFLANNIEGYDTPKETSLKISLGNTITPASTTVNMQLLNCGIYGGGAYNSGVSYFSLLVYGTINGQTGYYELNSSIVRNPQDGYPTLTAIPLVTSLSNLNYRGATQSAVFQTIEAEPSNQYLQPIAYYNAPPYNRLEYINANVPAYVTNYNGAIMPQIPVTGISSTQNFNVYPQLSSYAVGVVFYDYAMRKCGVVKNSPSYTLFNSFTNQITSSIPHTIDFGVGSTIASFIQPKDRVEIIANPSYNTSLNGIYNVVSVSGTSIIVSETLGFNLTVGSVSINIYRYTPSSPTTPARDYTYSTALSTINWTLDNTNAVNEIPDWAYYYSIVKTLNLRTRFFLQGFANIPKYMGKTAAGAWSPVNNIYNSVSCLAIGINTESLIATGLGYIYNDGDICILTRNDNTRYTIPVIGQDGNYILLKAQDISSGGAISNYTYVFEVYTPYKTSDQEPYYEMGEIYSIINPKTNIRSYSILNGFFNGDTYLLYRSFGANSAYIGNAMSPNDLYWKQWETDAGKVNIVTRLGRTDKNTNIAWSDTYVSGTQINGSSTFRLGNETFVSDDCGSITKLQLTSKVQDQGQGSVMLALCNSEINSMYLGETQIADSTGKTQFFSASTNVVSTINILKGNYGCISPESVVQYRGKVYFVDLANGRVVQYSDNGLDAISNVKMSRFWKNWAYKYQSLTKAEIEEFGDRPYIFSMVDSGHDELLISLPKLSDDPPKGYLPDYPNTIYPFDALDYQGKTMVYCLGTAAQVYPHWQGSYTFTTENFVSLQNRLFSFKGGRIFEHNQDIQNRFYGAYSPSSIMFTSNILSQVPKVYDNFVVESNLMPSFVYFYNNYPYIQTSDLDDTSFVNLEGIWYANILRNKIVPTATGFTTDGLLTAEVMRNTNMYVQATFSPTTEPLELRLIQLGTSISKGHIIT